MKLSLTFLLSFACGVVEANPFDQTSFDGTYHYPYEPFGVRKSAIHHDMSDDILKVSPTSRKSAPPPAPAAAEPATVDIDPMMQLDDFNQAEDAIFHAVEVAEKAVLHLVEHAVEEEVETFFHELPHHERNANAALGEEEHKEKKRRQRCFKDGVRECLEEMEHGDME